jgi:hypothetical protein
MSPQTLRGLLNRGTAVEDVPKRTYISKKQRGFTRKDVERIAGDLSIRIDNSALAELDRVSHNGG